MMRWLKDPDTGKPSVTLTMLVSSFILAVGSALAIALGLVRHTDYNPLLHIFMTCAGLYGARKNLAFAPQPGPSPVVSQDPRTIRGITPD